VVGTFIVAQGREAIQEALSNLKKSISRKKDKEPKVETKKVKIGNILRILFLPVISAIILTTRDTDPTKVVVAPEVEEGVTTDTTSVFDNVAQSIK